MGRVLVGSRESWLDGMRVGSCLMTEDVIAVETGGAPSARHVRVDGPGVAPFHLAVYSFRPVYFIRCYISFTQVLLRGSWATAPLKTASPSPRRLWALRGPIFLDPCHPELLTSRNST